MKKFRRIMALLIASVMVMAMGVTAFAAGETYSIKITAPTGHTYQVYQVFTGTPDNNQLTSLKYGQNTSKTAGGNVSQTDLKTLATLSGTDAQGAEGRALIAALKDFVNFDSTPITTISNGTTQQNLVPGYYVIRDTVNSQGKVDTPDGEGATLYMFKVLTGNLEISAKSDSPSSEKHVDDVNDSNANDHSELKDSADYDIGDEVPYTLTFTLPSDYANYEHYYVKFYDDMSKGLTYKTGSAKIKYGSGPETAFGDPVAGTSSYTDGGHMWTWEIMDLKSAAADLEAGDVITLTYKAVLNDVAVIGEDGNPNKMHVEFSNNPNNTGNGTSKPGDTEETPDDKNIVFTYKTVFNKVDEGNQPLPGADFKLEKKVNGAWVDVTTLGTDKHPVKIGRSQDKDTKFEFKGLDAGDYRLTETFTPQGYNPIEAIEFTITAEHDLVSNDPKLTSLTGNGGESFTLTPSKGEGSLTASVVNKSGAVLPTTGGVGTTMFYVIGAILVVGAGVVLVTRRRMTA